MKTAIITGITGQDGAYLAKLLLEKGYKVIGVTRNISKISNFRFQYLNIANAVQIVEYDLMDLSSVIKLIREYKPDEFYNLAAQSSVGQSFAQPIGTLHFNIISVLNILEGIRLMNPSTRFYQASSSEMFGKVANLPVTLQTQMHPLSPYAISKASAHWIVVNYREAYGIFACNGILFNHESFLREGNFFVKKVIRESILNRNNPGWKLQVGNLNVKRDFGYSPKFVEAMWLIIQQEKPRDLIICSGKSILLHNIVEHIFSRLNLDIKTQLLIDEKLFRPVDIEDIYGDNTESKAVLNWDYDLDFMDVLDLLIEEERRFLESSGSQWNPGNKN
ncbi:GDP-mannose 4,6-dehydratase [Segetibacter sp. 3557_3]|uniref:GDP-mannose 4,6-dehydratase n=1 Tax=Segetibacter sp. 3557_3 TaxID=2547429 RepID=UPI0010588FF4|nr:GDP-mannose 4,6-dehydratase [Segetibacter sp. 3557_3]TDH23323.1 GDP-mannose 4,6-dehydratase [Segetibacter sp. 3557_3]